MKNLVGMEIVYVEAHVRYWEDAIVDGMPDVEGSMIPFRDGDLWKIGIDIDLGEVLDWSSGKTARVHYKVCDCGEYFLADGGGRRAYRWTGDYVPDFLSVGERGYGDYIIMDVSGDGVIAQWDSRPELDPEFWEHLPTEFMPCPFCGCDDVGYFNGWKFGDREKDDDIYREPTVCCNRCGIGVCAGSYCHGITDEEALKDMLKHWNRRPGDRL